MNAKFDAIRAELERLRTAKRRPKVFGADSHGFELNPPLSEDVVQDFEAKYGIRLPEDYREFLIQMGNGGAGPCYGVFKLGEMDDSFDYEEWEEADGFVGILSKSFPHATAWNDKTGEPLETDDEDEYEKALEAFEKRYWDPVNVNGAIPICHEGCAYRIWLVVTGPEAGHLWHDARADHAGLFPLKKGRKERVTFLEWYIDWLNEAVAKLPKPRA